MTTNQTIDGVLVSRALLEKLVSPGMEGSITDDEWDELRALLDANPEENVPCPQCGGSLRTWGCNCTPRWPMHKESTAPNAESEPCAKSQVEPAAQPQGEPVAWINWSGGDCPVDADAMVEYAMACNPQQACGPEAACRLDWHHDQRPKKRKSDIVKYREIAEQPAPVAVVLPSVAYTHTEHCDTRFNAGWNACLDEVKRLNP